MKRLVGLLTVLVVFATPTFPKKVKFAVDLTGFEVSPNGVHVTGDFQTLAGFPGGDWSPNTTPMTREGSSGIFSIVVDIPAFRVYEYRFVNGDQFYETEFVPVESRVGYDFNDNRWIYVDSITNDTTFTGAIVFGGNAPAGRHLIRFRVNMQNETSVHPSGVHVAGSFQNWNPATLRLYSFVNGIFETILHLEPDVYQYKFYNGNTASSAETITGTCAVNGNRTIDLAQDTVMATVCFRYCVDCESIGLPSVDPLTAITLYPNPAGDLLFVRFPESMHDVLILYDTQGREVFQIPTGGLPQAVINISRFPSGSYFVSLKNHPLNRIRFIKQ